MSRSFVIEILAALADVVLFLHGWQGPGSQTDYPSSLQGGFAQVYPRRGDLLTEEGNLGTGFVCSYLISWAWFIFGSLGLDFNVNICGCLQRKQEPTVVRDSSGPLISRSPPAFLSHKWSCYSPTSLFHKLFFRHVWSTLEMESPKCRLKRMPSVLLVVSSYIKIERIKHCLSTTYKWQPVRQCSGGVDVS